MTSNITQRNVTLFRKCSQCFIDLIDVITSKKYQGSLGTRLGEPGIENDKTSTETKISVLYSLQ